MVFPETAKLIFFAKKAHGGKKKRTLIRAVMNPPAYPGTRSRGPVPMSPVPETDHIMLNQRGRLAPRWLQDFVSGELESELEPLQAFQSVGCASEAFRREEARKQGNACPDNVVPPVMRHELLLKGHQSIPGDPPSNQVLRRADGSECDEVLACVCQNCRYHFTFYIDKKPSRLCTRGTDPFHHLVFVLGEKSAPRSINSKFYPFHGRADYACSSTACTFKLTVEISKPRLSNHFLEFLTDNDAIRNRLKRAVEEEPERFADVANVTPNALAYLRIYLRDIVEGRSEKNPDGTEIERKIDQRNKKFFIQFGNGPEAAELLTYLGFEEIVDEDNRSWRVPNPTITRPTRPGSQLAFYQDVKSEVETFVGKDSQNMKPNAAISFITSALNIGDFTTSDHAYNEYRMFDYTCLGILPRMHERYFWYAYRCQAQTDPELEEDYFVSLKYLAQGRNNEELDIQIQSLESMRTAQPKALGTTTTEEEEIRLATEMSLQDPQPSVPQHLSSNDKVMQAYRYFGLDETQRSDDEVLGKFISNAEAYPSQKSNYREKLLLIARHTKSQDLERIALEDMSTEESLSYLGVEMNTDTTYIISIAQFNCQSNEKDRDLTAAALRQISQERGGDAMLASAAQDILSGQIDMSSTNQSDPMDIDAREDKDLVLDLCLPTGLKNIRNTCYLNSILQYFNTVKPVHEIIDNFDEVGLPTTEVSLRTRRIDPGAAHLERGEAYAGRQFVEQLSLLFNNMQESEYVYSVPTQRLAIAALKNSARLELDGKQILEKMQGAQNQSLTFDVVNKDGGSPPAPPLPLRRAAAATTVHINDSPTGNPAGASLSTGPDNADASSIKSADTLVEHGESQAQLVNDKRLGSAAEEDWQTVKQVHVSMEEVQEDDNTTSDAPIVVHAEHVEDNDVSAAPEVTMGNTGEDTAMDDVASSTAATKAANAFPGSVQTVFDPPPVAEPSMESVIELALEDTSTKGTDQQDVEEVMGNIISHLRASVKATGEDADTGVQRDAITDTFFWTSATYSRSERAGRYNRQIAPNRWVTAFPADDKKISLLQALSSSFQREFITQGTWYERFTSIVNLPPILHIHIQRSKGDGTKNRSPVDIPQVLHLDQFMDCNEGSELFARRCHAWNLQERIRGLRGPNGEESAITFHPVAISKASAYTDMIANQHIEKGKAEAENRPLIDIDGSEGSSDGEEFDTIDEEIKELMQAHGVSLDGQAATRSELVERVDAKVDEAYGPDRASAANKQFLDDARRLTPEEIGQTWARQDLVQSGNEAMRVREQTQAEYERELEGLFDDLKSPEHEYLLHAVICHSGNTGKAGHYWVWIYDFDRCLWRKYNDKVVREHPNTAAVMEELSNAGEPYYLAYVRASDVKNYVGVSLRKERSIPPPPPRPQAQSLPVISETAVSGPPVSNPKAHRLTTPPMEEGESKESSVSASASASAPASVHGLDGQTDSKPPSVKAPSAPATPQPESDGQMQ